MSVNINAPPVRPMAFTTEFFDCCHEPTSCCEALWCPWCSVAAQHNRLTRNAIGPDYLCCMTLCLLDMCCTFGLATVCTAAKYRGEIQRRYGIAQNDCTNCCAACFCLSCAISQGYREMCYRGSYPGGLCVSPPIGQAMGVDGQPLSPQMMGSPSATTMVVVAQTNMMTMNAMPANNNGVYLPHGVPLQPQPAPYQYPQQPSYQPQYANNNGMMAPQPQYNPQYNPQQQQQQQYGYGGMPPPPQPGYYPQQQQAYGYRGLDGANGANNAANMSPVSPQEERPHFAQNPNQGYGPAGCAAEY